MYHDNVTRREYEKHFALEKHCHLIENKKGNDKEKQDSHMTVYQSLDVKAVQKGNFPRKLSWQKKTFFIFFFFLCFFFII